MTNTLAARVLDIADINTWLADETGADGLAVEIYRASQAGDDEAKWLHRCILDNDAGALILAAKQIERA